MTGTREGMESWLERVCILSITRSNLRSERRQVPLKLWVSKNRELIPHFHVSPREMAGIMEKAYVITVPAIAEQI